MIASSRPRQSADGSPGSKESGLCHSMAQAVRRTPRSFITRLLSPTEIDRVRILLHGPQRPLGGDRRIINLGLAKIVFGKVVATLVAHRGIWRERYELRRGSDLRNLSLVTILEADTEREALAEAWSLARRHVGPNWRERLVQEVCEDHWTIFLPPPREWPNWKIRPYVLELRKIRP